ncbi:hypothetical protein ASPZODRAFT_60273 [Penicilliopsis zonata CBS 506.65]|uniref:DUF1996 domain-containing protein n=1 Tax=Penicilliopsis zonata CBS 506.65 TaxID=1073090 RepID=A0A1L9SNZ1_9EURO|nr:hypothetical protein ASPZODRAFT_60273 [Penicilliopsis zonata CBS 506.65]OJJ48972.1 hypothetical protein ASPZODRAFT_60273 [Penicilliopsis zonata CBS 506.65]
MHSLSQFVASLLAGVAVFSSPTDAFWRLPCRGRTGVARMDPLVDPGMIAYHAHAVEGSGNFALSVTEDSLRASNCTSCAVLQDRSAYWAPPLYFLHTNGSAELVEQVGGMLVYYLLYGENVTAFPEGFRMLAGDTYQRNFTWPIPDPPKSDWTGAQLSQKALQQKALGFNCLNYAVAAEPSLYRHFLPNKTFIDEQCVDGVRFELMFPSCWNGKDVDSPDHKSHMAYPTLVMDGDCPEGYESRLVSMFFETIWNTYAFKDVEGEFVIANGDPTGYGYHGDFITGWEPDFLQEAVETCTNATGMVVDCPIFDLQDEDAQEQCKFEVPEALQDENVYMHANGLPGNILIEPGPAYASPVRYVGVSTASASAAAAAADSTSSVAVDIISSTSAAAVDLISSTAVAAVSEVRQLESATPTMTSYETTVTQEIIYIEQEIVVYINDEGVPTETETAGLQTVSSTYTTTTQVVYSTVSEASQPVKRNLGHSHGHKHGHFFH